MSEARAAPGPRPRPPLPTKRVFGSRAPHLRRHLPLRQQQRRLARPAPRGSRGRGSRGARHRPRGRLRRVESGQAAPSPLPLTPWVPLPPLPGQAWGAQPAGPGDVVLCRRLEICRFRSLPGTQSPGPPGGLRAEF